MLLLLLLLELSSLLLAFSFLLTCLLFLVYSRLGEVPLGKPLEIAMLGFYRLNSLAVALATASKH